MTLSLAKETEAARLVLTKRQAPQIKAQMNLVLDVSGSMQGHYRSGKVGTVIQRLVALATVVDPDGAIETVAFSDSAAKGYTLRAGEFDKAQDLFLESAKSGNVIWGGTDYASGLAAIDLPTPNEPKKRGFFSNLFGSKQETQAAPAQGFPNLVFFITDGENSHGSDVKFKNILAQKKDTYFMLVGVGRSYGFDLLRAAADEFDNVGLLEANDFSKFDQEFFEQVMTDELVAWYKKQAQA